MHRRSLTAAAATALLLASTAGTAQAERLVDRVQVGAVKRYRVTKRFSPALAVTLRIPSGYERSTNYDGTRGAWLGPSFVADANPAFTGQSSIAWNVRFARGTNLETIAKREHRNYRQVSARARKVRHVIGKRKVDKLKAYAVIDAERSPGARVDGALAIGISRHRVAIVSFHALDPAVVDAGTPGKVTVDGKPAGAWNRKRVDAAFSKVYIEGNLPPSHVKARAKGRRVKGTLRDAFGGPVTDATVVLEKGRHTVASGTTNSRGRFALSAPRAGRYKVVGTLQGYSAKSRTVRVR